MNFMEAKKARTQEILLLLKAFDDEHKGAIEKIESVYRDEIVEDKKTLSDKIINNTDQGGELENYNDKEYLPVVDTKQFIKKIDDYIKNAPNSAISSGLKTDFFNKIRELAGERLI